MLLMAQKKLIPLALYNRSIAGMVLASQSDLRYYSSKIKEEKIA